ncbi:MAG: ABC transporter permease subunit [Saprospiraceae bacterium]|nr:ABC transporter permease subunit [Saprospiraceae bacterium]
MIDFFRKWKYLDFLEWQKFSKNTVIIVLLLLYVLFSPFVIFLAKEIFEGAPPPFPNVNSFFEFPLIWEYQGYVGSWFVSFNLGFIIIYIFTSEVSNKTLRQNIITGLSKNDFFLSKIATMIKLSIIATILYYISSIIIGIFHTPGSDINLIFDNNFAGCKFFVMCMGYMSFALFLAILFRRGMLAILAYFAYIHLLEVILRQIQLYFIKSRSMIFWPMNTFEDLFPLPFYRLPDTWLEESLGFKPLQTTGESILFSTIYTFIFIGLSWYFFRKRDA